ncbi:hypothetical protein GCWU000321_01207 [Dialister invisus DSM 15470]|uniref:Uncharacterized protein n=1 Tax=Dialister invisus DSM 15470 TaxID=592028 RepID=C9LNT5_9FIRM|nr:hypothetical protein GCWU000321_01207 [Dialister invisus DSM 15470]
MIHRLIPSPPPVCKYFRISSYEEIRLLSNCYLYGNVCIG